MSYRETLGRLADETERRAVAIHAAYIAGELSHDEAVALLAAAVAQGNARATSLADLALAAEIMAALGEAVPVVGVPLQDDTDRLRKAATTLLTAVEKSPVPEAIVRRLARSEVFKTANRTYGEAMRASPHVKGWVRDLEGEACELCTWWWREGRVWPDSHPMPTHPGCECTAKPVVTKEIQQLHYNKPGGQGYAGYRAGLDRRATAGAARRARAAARR